MTSRHGRVFTRLALYDALPVDAKREIESLEHVLVAHQSTIFKKHHPTLFTSAVGVKYKDMKEAIATYLGDPAGAGHDGQLKAFEADRVMRLLDGLVFKGFITPYKEDDRQLDSIDYDEKDLFVPLAPVLAALNEPSMTVWDVATGAIYANTVHRKTNNIIDKLAHGSDAYVIVDTISQTLTLFETDLSREAIVQIHSHGAQVAEDRTYFNCGVKVGNDTVVELLDLPTNAERDAFIDALREIGVKWQSYARGNDHAVKRLLGATEKMNGSESKPPRGHVVAGPSAGDDGHQNRTLCGHVALSRGQEETLMNNDRHLAHQPHVHGASSVNDLMRSHHHETTHSQKLRGHVAVPSGAK